MSELESFRRETRAWLEANCPAEMRRPVVSEDDACWGGRRFKFQSEAQRRWLQSMGERGWTVPAWPKAYGGGGLSKEEAAVLNEEMRALGCRAPLSSFGIWMLGPALLAHGTEEQKREHLPRIARGEIRWCQGYSEPNAGSDLASLRNQGRGHGRPLPHQRPENLDFLCRQGRLDFLPGAHRAPRKNTPAFVRAVRHGVAGRIDAADRADLRQVAVLRNLLRQCARAARRNLVGTTQRRLGHRQIPAHARARNDSGTAAVELFDNALGEFAATRAAGRARASRGSDPARRDRAREIDRRRFAWRCGRASDRARSRASGEPATSLRLLKYDGTELNKRR